MACTSGAFWEFSYTGANKGQDEGRLSHGSRNDGGSSHHHKLAQLEDLGELIAHAGKTRDASVTPLV